MVSTSVRSWLTVAAFTPIVLGAVGPDCVNGPLKSNKICDTTATPAERASALVSALNQDEKLKLLVR